MPIFRVTFTDGRTEDVDGETVTAEGTSHVIRAVRLVIGSPRQVVVRRLRAADVRDITAFGALPQHSGPVEAHKRG